MLNLHFDDAADMPLPIGKEIKEISEKCLVRF
jgi:hypothetical protein